MMHAFNVNALRRAAMRGANRPVLVICKERSMQVSKRWRRDALTTLIMLFTVYRSSPALGQPINDPPSAATPFNSASPPTPVATIPPPAPLSSPTPSTAKVTGTIVDAANGGAIPGATIEVAGLTTVGLAESDGAFELAVAAPGRYVVTFSAAGYVAVTRMIDVAVGDRHLGLVALTEDSTAVGNEIIQITPGSFSLMGSRGASKLTMKSEDIKNMSWAEDVTRAVARLPGISSSDYSSKFSIRGGDVDEVLFTLDGMELYEPFHQRDFSGGLFSIVDIAAIEGVELNTGGFAANHGNRLSGMLNMYTKEGRDDSKPHLAAGLSLMNAYLYTDGPFANHKGFYQLSARRGVLDLTFRAAGTTESLPEFYDTFGKVAYRLHRRHSLSLHLLHSGDKTTIRDVRDINFDKNDTAYYNTYSWATLKSQFGTTLFADTMIYASFIKQRRRATFFKDEPLDKGNFQLTDDRGFLQFGVKQDWKWIPSNHTTVQAGIDVKRVQADYKYRSHLAEIRADSMATLYDFENTTELSPKPRGVQVGAYLTTQFHPLRRLYIEPGVRFDLASYASDKVVSPRLAAAYQLAKPTILRAAFGYYYQSQFIDQLDVNHGNARFDRAKLAKHYVLGLEHEIKDGIKLRVEGYYKDLTRLPSFWTTLRDHLEAFPEQRNDNALVVLDGATSKGIEIFAKYDRGGKFSWWLSYALAKAEDNVREIQFDGILTPRTGKVPRLNNQRHTVFADLNYRPTANWHFNLSWQAYVGWPRTDYTFGAKTLPDGRLHFYPIELAYNGVEYPAYHRMDLRINRHFPLGNGKITAFVHLINLYNQQNLRKFDLDTHDDAGNPSLNERGEYIAVSDNKYWLGFIPVVGVNWETTF